MIKLVGLKNCDTCRKAKKWLEAEGIDFTFHDVRADGLTQKDLENWADKLGWENLLNKRGTTWRGLEDNMKETVDQTKAISLMVDHPALMKRPVFVKGDDVIFGFKQDQMDAIKILK